jgi:hypothetical protein
VCRYFTSTIVQFQNNHVFTCVSDQSYHGGSSHGYSRAEAVNFAPASWLPYVREALAICAQTGADPAVAPDELQWSTIGYILKKKQEADKTEANAETEDATAMATTDNHIPHEDVTYILDDLDVLIQHETKVRNVCQEPKITLTKPLRTSAKLGDTVCCCICRYPMFASHIKCTGCSSGFVCCHNHIDDMCDCSNVKLRCFVYLPIHTLNSVRDSLHSIVASASSAATISPAAAQYA